MLDMPPTRTPHLHREVTRHGKVVWYARAGGGSRGPRVKLHAEYGTPEFWAEYQAALASSPRKPAAPHEGRSPGLWSGTARRRRGRISLRLPDVSARISSCTSSTPPATNHSPKLRRRPSWPGATVALIRRPKLAIF